MINATPLRRGLLRSQLQRTIDGYSDATRLPSGTSFLLAAMSYD